MLTRRFDFLEKALSVLVTLLIIYVIYLLYDFFAELGDLLSVLYPFIIAGIFFYLFRPVVRLLKKKLPTTLSILLTFLFILMIFTFIAMYIYPITANQVSMLVAQLKDLHIESTKINYSNIESLFSIKNIIFYIHNIINQLYLNFLENFILYFNFATQFFISLCVVPIILFYFLKEDFSLKNIEIFPNKYQVILQQLFTELDDSLTHLIHGRMLISFIVSSLLFIIFLSIGLDYSYVIYLTSLLFFIIPTVGSIIAAFFPVLIGFSMNTFMGFEVLIIMICGIIVEGCYLTPKIIGQELYIHPLTIILILLIAGYLSGIVGLIVCTPVYVVFKILFKHSLQIARAYKIQEP
jgi:predicted PurR-regulated permease PerM